MRIILATSDNLEHVYVANRLAAEVPLDGIVVDHGRRISLLANVRRLYRKYTLLQIASRLQMAVMTRVWRDETIGRRSMVAAYGPANCLQFSRPDLLHHIHGINSPEGLQTISSLQPDVLLIYGTVLVGSKIISQARVLALNMHTGISPYYRGADCAFWPIYNQEPHMVGATVHECTRDIDGGKIFGTAKAQLAVDDDVFSVFARSVMAGANLYAEIVRELIAGKLRGADQDLSQGKEYRARMRDVRAERKVRRSINEGIIRRYLESGQGDRKKSS
ncbi:MAG: formyl transferase [Candidatus Acidiferrales bacterium]